MCIRDRLVRVFRLLRLVSFIPQFRILIESFVTAIPRVSYILLFMFVEFYIFAAIGSILFSEISPMHWDNVGLAMLTLFQTATLEGWPDLMYQSLEVQRFSWIFFVVFIILNSLVFMNMIIGVIIGTYSSVFIAVPTLLIFKFRPQDEDD